MSHPVPFETAKLRGFPGKQRGIQSVPQPMQPEAVPEPFSWLCEAAQAEWRRLAPELHRLKLLTPLDLGPFAAYCASFARWAEAERLLETEDLTSIGSTGNTIPNPLTRVATEAARSMCKMACEFAMTPCSRARIRAGWDDGSGGPGKFDGLLG